MSGFALASSQIGGWNLDIHHTYNYQEGNYHLLRYIHISSGIHVAREKYLYIQCSIFSIVL